MATTTVRAHEATVKKLRQLAAETRRTMPDLIAESVELLERDRLLDSANEAFAALRADERAWQEELAERAAWDGTLADDVAADG